MKKVLVITGPTAVGKTALSIHLAKRLKGEIISGDSMQVYRQLDIGTAKVTEQEKQGIPHYLIDCREIGETYSAADFQQEGRRYIEAISEKGMLPIIVGGTGLYIQSLLYDFKLGGSDDTESSELRKAYEEFAIANGNEALWQTLEQKDPLAAASIHYNNRKKVIRALEVFELTGYSIMTPKEEPKALYDAFLIGLDTPRPVLYQRINQRVDSMLHNGLLDEAEYMSHHRDAQAAQGIGYKEFFPYFDAHVDFQEAVEQVKQNSRRYAKRQLTWFKNRMSAHWYDLVSEPEQLQVLEEEVSSWLDQ